MTLKDLIAKVTTLSAKVDATLREEVNTLKAQVEGALTDALAQVKDLTAKLSGLEAEKGELNTQISTLTNNLSDKNKELLAFNDALTDACLNGKLLDLKTAADAKPDDIRAAALAVPMTEKFKAYQGALNAAFAKAGLPNSTLPTPPAGAALPSAQAGARKMKMSDFRNLNPKDQSDFCAAVRKGQAVLDMD